MNRVIHISAAGSAPIVQITVGQAQFGKFGLYLFASQTTFSTLGIGHTPPGQQSFSMGAASALPGKFIAWDVIVAPFGSGDGQLFSVTLEVFQDGQRVSAFTDNGQFTGTVPKLIRASASIAT